MIQASKIEEHISFHLARLKTAQGSWNGGEMRRSNSNLEEVLIKDGEAGQRFTQTILMISCFFGSRCTSEE
jgi:hypothetical protein